MGDKIFQEGSKYFIIFWIRGPNIMYSVTGVGERCHKRILWSQLLHGVSECCYERMQWPQLLQGVSELVTKGYSGSSYYNALKDVLMKC